MISEIGYKGDIQSNSLDISKHNSNTGITAPCKASKYFLAGGADSEGLYPHYKTFCKSYRCEYCGPRKVYMVRTAIEVAIKKFNLAVFATLTLDAKTVEASGSVTYIRRAWNKFRILQKRNFEKNLDFVSILEFQKNGRAHLHILFNEYIPHDWLRKTWVSVGGGAIVHVKKADERAAYYMSKYLSKSMIESAGFKNRIVSTSQSIKLMKLIKKMDGLSDFYFCKVTEPEARNILGEYIVSNIVDRKGFTQGFRASRRLQTKRTNVGK